ncbi:hypothetical protein RHSIM_Rhsim13G0087200 [Rhododendron simsii]|uniref:Uncharacterized protein n=1 Tax=Rhododendron simsii TaxID=118357 RepID=A0A834L500_RHOSS|nr:hypothetical protein RHSIM_Rhsim13G0087200 [Rhododendron simsii]
MPILKITIGTVSEASHPNSLKAALAEFFSMLIFVFAGMAFSNTRFNFSQCSLQNYKCKLTNDGSSTPAGLVAAALAHAFVLFVAVSVGANIFGGHVNPAVTFGAFIGGHITLLRSILYWIAQCLGSIAACLLLKYATGGQIVMTFGLVYTVYTTALDPKMGNVGIVAPIAIGFMVATNILGGGAFDGASMNPAVSFGSAAVSWTWDNHWVYWLSPFLGSAIAGLVYEVFFIRPSVHQVLPATDY